VKYLLTEVQPDPKVWPVCGTCDTPFVLKRAFQFGESDLKGGWFWTKDCAKPRSTCKKITPVLVNADGPVDPASIQIAHDDDGQGD
jgi:hypothetical protein